MDKKESGLEVHWPLCNVPYIGIHDKYKDPKQHFYKMSSTNHTIPYKIGAFSSEISKNIPIKPAAETLKFCYVRPHNN